MYMYVLYIYIYTYANIRVYIYIYIYMYVCVYIYIYIYREREIYIHSIVWRHFGSSSRCPCIAAAGLISPFEGRGRRGPDRRHGAGLATQNTTTTCVPSFFCPTGRSTSEVVVRRALGLYFQQQLLEI